MAAKLPVWEDKSVTPRFILEGLGDFDLDPCCSIQMPWRTAKRMLLYDPSLPRHILKPVGNSDFMVKDGLDTLWSGRVFLNPPYVGFRGRHWIARLAEHGNGIALLSAQVETKWFFNLVWSEADSVMFVRSRLPFYKTDGKETARILDHGSVLAAYGQGNSKALRDSGIDGIIIDLK